MRGGEVGEGGGRRGLCIGDWDWGSPVCWDFR